MIEVAYEQGYLAGRKALGEQSRKLLDAPKPRITDLAIKNMTKASVESSRSGIPSVDELKKISTDPLQLELFQAFMEYRDAADDQTEVYKELLSFMEADLRGSELELAETVNSQLARLRVGNAAMSDIRSLRSIGLVLLHSEEPKSGNETKECSACDFLLGFANGQMEMIMDAVVGGDYPGEEVLNSLLPILADCSIPFPLAPSYLTGWEGEFSGSQTDRFHMSLEKFGDARRRLISSYLAIQVARESDLLVA
jgi:hypothetical protein